MKTYLVAHDFSPCGDAALAEAADLAKCTKAKLLLLHVHPRAVVPPGQQTGEQTYNTLLQDNDELKQLVAEMKEHDVVVELESVVGEPGERILSEANRLEVDMIITGTHGRKGLQHFLLGSVAERVVREAQCAVLVVRV